MKPRPKKKANPRVKVRRDQYGNVDGESVRTDGVSIETDKSGFVVVEGVVSNHITFVRARRKA